MAASGNMAQRRRRYTARPKAQPATLTPGRFQLLRFVADFRIVSLPQLAALSGFSPKACRRQMRELLDSGWVDIIPIHRSALADPGQLLDASSLFGSAPNIYRLTRSGQRVLVAADVDIDQPAGPPALPVSSLFVAHELGIRDFRVWLTLTSQLYHEHNVRSWQDGGLAEIDLQRKQPPCVVRPDAWFVYGLGTSVLVGLLEYDRGTERGGRRWKEKLAAYRVAFESGRLRQVTGYLNARVLVVTPDVRRRDKLAELIGEYAPTELACRFWLADRSVLREPGFEDPVWRQPLDVTALPLVPPALAITVAPPGATQGGSLCH